MKRSSQVLLVIMGVAGTTAVGHYLASPRTECVQQAPQAKADNPQQTPPPCNNTSSTRTGSHSGSSSSNNSSSSEHTNVASSQTSAHGAERGGFGSTGHGFFSGS